jgi:hypothetical protein
LPEPCRPTIRSAAAKAVIIEEVERLRWRLWNGKAKDARISIGRVRAVMHHFRGEPGGRRSIAPSRKLWTALRALDGHLVGQNDRLANYGERHRAGLRVGTALTEGTANFLVNRRMNKSQQMRWVPMAASPSTWPAQPDRSTRQWPLPSRRAHPQCRARTTLPPGARVTNTSSSWSHELAASDRVKQAQPRRDNDRPVRTPDRSEAARPLATGQQCEVAIAVAVLNRMIRAAEPISVRRA